MLIIALDHEAEELAPVIAIGAETAGAATMPCVAPAEKKAVAAGARLRLEGVAEGALGVSPANGDTIAPPCTDPICIKGHLRFLPLRRICGLGWKARFRNVQFILQRALCAITLSIYQSSESSRGITMGKRLKYVRSSRPLCAPDRNIGIRGGLGRKTT